MDSKEKIKEQLEEIFVPFERFTSKSNYSSAIDEIAEIVVDHTKPDKIEYLDEGVIEAPNTLSSIARQMFIDITKFTLEWEELGYPGKLSDAETLLGEKYLHIKAALYAYRVLEALKQPNYGATEPSSTNDTFELIVSGNKDTKLRLENPFSGMKSADDPVHWDGLSIEQVLALMRNIIVDVKETLYQRGLVYNYDECLTVPQNFPDIAAEIIAGEPVTRKEFSTMSSQIIRRYGRD